MTDDGLTPGAEPLDSNANQNGVAHGSDPGCMCQDCLADDSNGGECKGSVQVAVPHDVRQRTCDAVDSGQCCGAAE